MRWKAVLLVLAVSAAGCSDTTGDAGAPPITEPSDTAPTPQEADLERIRAKEARVAAIAAWADRPLSEILADGFDTDACSRETATGDDGTDAASVSGLGWAFLPLPLEVVELEGAGNATQPAVLLSSAEVFPGPDVDYSPTHARILDDDLPMLQQLAGADDETGAEVVLGFGPTETGRTGDGAARPVYAAFIWLVTDDHVIPFTGECAWVTTFGLEVGDPLAGLDELRRDPYRRAEIAGLTENEADFSTCRNEEVDLTKRIGFGGVDVGLAFGPWPPDADAFADISLEGWTVIAPPGEESPAYAVRGDDGFPRGAGLDRNGWLLTFTVVDGQAQVETLFHADSVLGLRIWPSPDFIGQRGPCFDARQVLAFREFIDDAIPDRPAWDLSPAQPGNEQTVVDTLRTLMSDTAAQAAFHAWTPCTYKLCELNEEVVR